jgi:hypothetical protein
MSEANIRWPFSDPPNTKSYTTVNVLDKGAPILLVTHDLDDGSWQFHCTKTLAIEDARIIGLDCALGLDPTIAELADLPRGWRATREDARAPWTREPRPPDTDEDA